ncbi:MAG: carboxypeptidase-like regulatory domain-containing protein, partial [Acidobacteriota bacterium]|nr:carboxypeptidase-like regulatory domain-containing protein [Acidobacteriota bacterium]
MDHLQMMKWWLIVFAIPVLFAQEAQQGSITGYVSDASHAMMPNVEVVVTNKGTNLSRRAQTTNAGLYTFVGLDPGTYGLH